MRLRLDLGYDGSGFSGWAKQPERRTVEGVLDEALAVVLRLDAAPGLTVAGRTDAGVHARGQVAHSDVPAEAWAANGERALFRLSGLLPVDVRVTAGAGGAGRLRRPLQRDVAPLRLPHLRRPGGRRPDSAVTTWCGTGVRSTLTR